MYKKMVLTCLLGLLFILLPMQTAARHWWDLTMEVEGVEVTPRQFAQLNDGRLYASYREILEELDIPFRWAGTTLFINEGVEGQRTVQLRQASANQTTTPTNCECVLIIECTNGIFHYRRHNGQVVIPLRHVFEYLGYVVLFHYNDTHMEIRSFREHVVEPFPFVPRTQEEILIYRYFTAINEARVRLGFHQLNYSMKLHNALEGIAEQFVIEYHTIRREDLILPYIREYISNGRVRWEFKEISDFDLALQNFNRQDFLWRNILSYEFATSAAINIHIDRNGTIFILLFRELDIDRFLEKSIVLYDYVLTDRNRSSRANYVQRLTALRRVEELIYREEVILLGLINEMRRENRLHELIRCRYVDAAACYYSLYLSRVGDTALNLRHFTTDGRGPAHRMIETTPWMSLNTHHGRISVLETLATVSSGQLAFRAWQTSPGHYRQMRSNSATRIGISLQPAQSRTIYTLIATAKYFDCNSYRGNFPNSPHFR